MTETARLIESAQGGSREALEVLYARHQGRLLNLVRARMPTWLAGRMTAEDVVQETLLESTRKIGRFEPLGPAAFYRWLVEIARYKLAEAERAQRANKRAPAEPLDGQVPAEQTSPSGRVMRAESGVRLREGLAQLPERQAEAVRMRYLEGRSVDETAGRLGCSAAAVKSLVSRGLMRLAEIFSQESGGSALPSGRPTP